MKSATSLCFSFIGHPGNNNIHFFGLKRRNQSGKRVILKLNRHTQFIKAKGKIVVGTATGYYPFEMADKNGQLVGYDIDVAKAIAKDKTV